MRNISTLPWLVLTVSAGSIIFGQDRQQLPLIASYSEAYVLTTEQPRGEGQISIDGSNVEVRFSSLSTTLQVTLIDPSGGVHPAGQTDSVVQNAPIVPVIDPSAKGQSARFYLVNPQSGMWTYQLSDPELRAAVAPVLITVISDSDLTMSVLGTGGDFAAGGRAMLNLLLVNKSGPIPSSAISSLDATVQAQGAAEIPITFADDGANGDVKANDGVYTARFATPAPGLYAVRVNGTMNIGGQTILRSAGSSFRVAESCGTLSGAFTTAAVSSIGTGQPDALDVTFDLTAARDGDVRVSATLAAGDKSVAAGATATLTAGAKRITVRFPLTHLKVLGANGPYQVNDARLTCVQSGGAKFISDQRAGMGSTMPFDLTGAVAAAVPRNSGVGLTGDNTDQGADSTNAGKFDRLNFSAGVDISQPGAYQWNASLYDSRGTLIDQVQNNGTLPAGRSRVLLPFTGTNIGGNGVDGPYLVRDFCLQASNLACFAEAGSTQPYAYTRFAGSPGAGCTFTISPASQQAVAGAGGGTVSVATSAPCAWTAASNAPWITIASGATGTGNGTVSFSVSANTGAARTGTLTIAGQTFTVTQAAAAPAQTGPAISATPASLDFGGVNPGTPKELTLVVRNSGSATLNVTSVTSSNPLFTFIRPTSVPFPIGAGSSENVVIRFSPSAAGSQTGTLTIASNDIVRPTLTTPLSGSGAGSAGTGGAQSVTLSVDDGTFENTVGFVSGGITGYFVNRLTPPSYPATLRSIQIFFPASQLPAGTPINVVVAVNPSGASGPQITGLQLQAGSSQIPSVDRFIEFNAPPLTIQAGDFIIGFSAVNPPNILPAVLDKTAPSRQRSYVSSDGATFILVDGTGAGAGNFGIRAVVDVNK